MRSRHRRMDDERLARLVGTGDADAFEALYDRHAAPLLAFCRHMLGNREDGEDALQQAFVRAHRALAAGRAPDRVRPGSTRRAPPLPHADRRASRGGRPGRRS